MLNEKTKKLLDGSVAGKNFMEATQGLDNDKILNLIGTNARFVEQIKDELRDHVELERLKEEIREIKAPYSDTKKFLEAKISFCNHVLLERGVDYSVVKEALNRVQKEKGGGGTSITISTDTKSVTLTPETLDKLGAAGKKQNGE